jgi:hypothetical protein
MSPKYLGPIRSCARAALGVAGLGLLLYVYWDTRNVETLAWACIIAMWML